MLRRGSEFFRRGRTSLVVVDEVRGSFYKFTSLAVAAYLFWHGIPRLAQYCPVPFYWIDDSDTQMYAACETDKLVMIFSYTMGVYHCMVGILRLYAAFAGNTSDLYYCMKLILVYDAGFCAMIPIGGVQVMPRPVLVGAVVLTLLDLRTLVVARRAFQSRRKLRTSESYRQSMVSVERTRGNGLFKGGCIVFSIFLLTFAVKGFFFCGLSISYLDELAHTVNDIVYPDCQNDVKMKMSSRFLASGHVVSALIRLSVVTTQHTAALYHRMGLLVMVSTICQYKAVREYGSYPIPWFYLGLLTLLSEYRIFYLAKLGHDARQKEKTK